MLKALYLAMLVISLILPLRATAMPQAYLIQNSGWMEPFYTDQSSQFKPLIKALISVTARPEDPITIAAFNQSLSGNQSPKALYQGVGNGNFSSSVDGIQPARKPGGASFTDTDLNEAIKTTIIDYFKGSPGIVWLFSNNRNSPDNSQNTARKNREFYNLLHREPSITRVLAFPIGMPVKGRYYRSSGAMIYALAYGEKASVHLSWLQQSGQIGKILNEAPARLKPLDAESVRLVPNRINGNDQISAELASDQQTLVLNVDAGISLPVAEISASIINDFSPYLIERAKVSARFRGNDWDTPLPISTDNLRNLKPGESKDITVQLPIPLGEIPSIWSPAALSSAGKQMVLPAVIEIRLSEQQLQVDKAFIQKLDRLFPGDPLSSVFTPPEEVQSSTASIPVSLRISYPLYPLLIVILLVLVLIGLIIAGKIISGGSNTFDLYVNDEKRKVVLGAFKTTDIQWENQNIAKVRRILGAPKVIKIKPEHRVKVLGLKIKNNT